jgi:RimJ/RimL family protein N-acetyltransferase
VVVTERFRLVAWRIEDAPALRAALDASDAHLRPWIPFMRYEPRTLAETEQEIARHREEFSSRKNLRYAIWDAEQNTLLGEAMLLSRAGPRGREVGYWVHADHCRRGIASEAVAAIVGLAFEDPAIERVVFQCDEKNAASNAIPRRLGATAADAIELNTATLVVWTLERATYDARG